MEKAFSPEIFAEAEMATNEVTFAYADPPDSLCGQDDFVLRVPVGLRSKAILLTALEEAGRFPGYFGHNWDALEDCLRDLSWISNKTVVVVHGDLPLRDNPEDCRVYLDILQCTLSEWAKGPKPNAMELPPGWTFVQHEMKVAFPAETKALIEGLVTGT